MKAENKKLIAGVVLICLLLSSCQKVIPVENGIDNGSFGTVSSAIEVLQDDILVNVFGTPIYKAEYEKACENYTDFAPKDVFEGLVREIVVLHKADELGYTVTEDEITDRINELKEINPNYYELAIKQYETEEQYRDALKNRILYTKVFDTVTKEVESKYKYKDDIIEAETAQFISENGMESDMSEEIKSTLVSNYTEIVKQVYFKKWNYDEAIAADIEYISYTDDTDTEEKNSDIVIDKGVPEFLPMDIDVAQKLYSAYLDLQPSCLKQDYEIEMVKSTPATQTAFQKLFVSYTSKYYSNKRVTIFFVLNPFSTGNASESKENNTVINGFDSVIKHGYSEETDREKSHISLSIKLNEINGILNISSENCTESEIDLIVNNCFKLEKII